MRYYVVDAFTDELFKGNPAGVCVCSERLSAELMQKIAYENDLAETAFLTINKGKNNLRWFTPRSEIGLCGHATLAAAHVCFEYECSGNSQSVKFDTASGTLRVERIGGGLYEMGLPKRELTPCAQYAGRLMSVGIEAEETYLAVDVIAVVTSEEDVRSYVPDYDALGEIFGDTGIVITARGDTADIVSRYFCPELKREDAVTGSSHCALAPLWARRLGKETLSALQLSERGGAISCRVDGDTVFLKGRAMTYLAGEMLVPETP